MNIVDVILALILLYGAVRGFFRGFFAELASLVGFVVGIYGAIHFSYILSEFLAENVSWDAYVVNLIAFAITFFLIVFIISLAGNFLTKMANFAMLGILNRLFGAAFGFIKVAFITSVVMMFFNATNEDINLVDEETLQGSVLYGPVRIIAPTLLPSILKEARELELLNDDSETENSGG
mgnify:CR=1 FL=1